MYHRRASTKNEELGKIGIRREGIFNSAGGIDLMRERMHRLKGQQTEQALRVKKVQELQDYLMAQKTNLTKFDEELFRRFVRKG